jgi:NAD(P)-dependent dehydrogenase (short-subunit alcohol dehydrogenase family)
VVVGAASGIGAATAARLHSRGDFVLAVDRRQHDTPASEYADCDLSKPESISRFISSIGTGWDALAHVAGVPGTAPALDVVKINYLGMRLMTEQMLPLMRPGGAIVTVGSTAALGWEQRIGELSSLLKEDTAEGVERWCTTEHPAMAYYTSKQALILYAKRTAQRAWATHGVRVNVVSPGPVETAIFADFEATMGREALEAVRGSVGRHATPDDIVPVIEFLISEQARWVNGQNVQVDGGYMASLV